jgi:hypothetical protein
MRRGQHTVDPASVQLLADQLLRPLLGIWPVVRTCTLDVVVRLLCYAAARITSLHDACAALRDAPDSDTILGHLTRQVVDRDTLDRRVREVLRASLPRAVRRGRWVVAVDTTHIPYHGEPFADASEVYRSQAKGGTTRSHAYATAFVVRDGLRFTLAILPVVAHTPMRDVVRELRTRVAQAGVRTRLLLLDRGFDTAGVVRHLQAARQRFIMPQVVHGKKPKSGVLSGLRAIRAYHPTGWTTYTWTPAKQRSVTVDLCVVRRRRRNRHGGRAFLYACGGVRMNPRSVYRVYRTRFGIETSYRQMNQLRVRTTTRNPAVRLLFVAVALLLRNLWAWLHWVVLSDRIPGGRRVRLARLRLRTVAWWLLHLAEQLLGWVDHAMADQPPDEPLVDRRRLRP